MTKSATPVAGQVCPHCGGLNGYQTRVVLAATRYYAWSGAERDTDHWAQKSESKPVCSDCGKRIVVPAQ
jgi:ribosomal protein L32